MSIGKTVRKLLGVGLFPIAARYYRNVFTDLEKVSVIFSQIIPENGLILYIGGGDGALLNSLLVSRKDVTVTMIDLSESVGSGLHPEFQSRVKILPCTSVAMYHEYQNVFFNTVIISDVIHHIPVNERILFFKDILELCRKRNGAVKIIVKEIGTSGIISKLGFLADRYISNDKNVSFISQEDLQEQLKIVFPEAHFIDTGLSRVDFPNYAFSFSFN